MVGASPGQSQTIRGDGNRLADEAAISLLSGAIRFAQLTPGQPLTIVTWPQRSVDLRDNL